jgi:Leucine-rich repeat (LRR) protein
MSITSYGGFYNLVRIRCYWVPFVDLMSNMKDVQNSTIDQNGVLNLYEIEFNDQKIHLNLDSDPTTVNSKLFDGIRISKLIMRNLNVKQIDSNAFDKCCRQSLQHLDLSMNKLKRVNFLDGLHNLRYLNLGSNQIQLKDSNFAANPYLKEIDLSSNQLHYIPEKLFDNLHKLETINLNTNQIDELSACVFQPLNTQRFFNIHLNLQNNSIKCNCDMFYLKRMLGFRLNLVCGSNEPAYYVGKHINSLDDERPDRILCNDYKSIEKRCSFLYDFNVQDYERYFIFRNTVIVLSVLLAVLIMLVVCMHRRLSARTSIDNTKSLLNANYDRLVQQ